MTVNNNKKNIWKIVLVTLLSLAVAVCVIVGVIFGLRSAWKSKIINEVPLPSAENGITLKLHEYGTSDGKDYSRRRTIKYSPSKQGLWFDITDGSRHVFTYDDMAYWSYDSSTEYWQISECFPADSLQYKLSTITFTNIGLFSDLYDLVLENRAEVVESVWKWGNSYYAALDGDYLIDNNFNEIDRNPGLGISSHYYDDFKCTFTENDGVLQSICISYIRNWQETFDYFRIHHSEKHIELEVEQGADFSSVELPTTFVRSLSQRQGDLLKSCTTYEGEYIAPAYVTPDGAATVYAHSDEEEWRKELSAYGSEGVLTAVNSRRIEIYALSDLEKLCSLEFYANIAGCDVAEGKLAVVVSGRPDTGAGELNGVMPKLSWAYVYDLETLAEIGRYDIGGAVSQDSIDSVVYDGECVYFVCGEEKNVLNLSTGQTGSTDSIPSSFKGTDGGGFTFVPHIPVGEEGYYYPTPVYFSSPDYTGFSFGGYDVVGLQRDEYAFGLFDRQKGKYVYIFPRHSEFGSGQPFVCSLGDGKYLCFTEYTLFALDFPLLQTHQYDNVAFVG